MMYGADRSRNCHLRIYCEDLLDAQSSPGETTCTSRAQGERSEMAGCAQECFT